MDFIRRFHLNSMLKNYFVLKSLNEHFRFLRVISRVPSSSGRRRFIVNRENFLRFSFGQSNNNNSSRWSFIIRNFYFKRLSLLAGSGGLVSAAGFFGSFDSFDDFFNNSGGNFFRAVRENDVDTLETLIKHGEDPNQRHNLGWTPLHVAAFRGHVESIKLLIDNGADVNSPDEYSTFKSEGDNRRLNHMEVLFQRQNEFSSNLRTNANFRGTTPLHYAVLGDHIDVVKLLIEKGADPLVRNESGHSPMDYARDDKMRQVLSEYLKIAENLKKMREKEERLRYPLEQRIKEVLVGQEGAIAIVAETIRRKENGWYDDDHPLVFLFLGSSGIGKTELAKQVANYLHKDMKKAFIRIDMSEYQAKHEVAKFIGSPPGYVGHDEGGQLTKKLKEFPKAVVLFDEVEKAHPDILTIMLQLFDEGRLTDGKGNTVECKEAIFIMTSNLASEEIANYAVKLRDEAVKNYKEKMSDSQIGSNLVSSNVTVTKKFKEEVVQPILKRHFKRDEFLGRITEMVYFLPFSRSELISLVTKEMELWKKRAKDRHNVDIVWDADVLDVLADGYNVRYGARSIKHEVERRVVNKLASAHERQLITDGSKVRIFTTLLNESSPATFGDDVDRSKAGIELEIIKNENVIDSSLLNNFKKYFV